MLASDPAGPGFETCKASSFIPGFECEAGFANKMKDSPHMMWVSDGEGIGAALEIKFKTKY